MSPRLAIIALSLSALALVGCAADLSSNSGTAFRAAYTDADLIENPRIDRRVADLLRSDSTLEFPTRIGLARISDGELTEIPAAEGDAWASLEARLGPEFGTFVPLDLQAAETVTGSPSGTSAHNPLLHQAVERVRLGAAQQQLTALLLYEIDSVTSLFIRDVLPTDITIVGAFILPNRGFNTTVWASALLVDVRDGRPHGSAGTQVAADSYTTTARYVLGREEHSLALSRVAVARLAEDVEQMMRGVKREMDLAGAAE